MEIQTYPTRTQRVHKHRSEMAGTDRVEILAKVVDQYDDSGRTERSDGLSGLDERRRRCTVTA